MEITMVDMRCLGCLEDWVGFITASTNPFWSHLMCVN